MDEDGAAERGERLSPRALPTADVDLTVDFLA
jgi:hypothetical protein